MGPDRPFWIGFVCWTLIIVGMIAIYGAMKQLGTAGFDDSMSIFPYPVTVAKTIFFGSMAIFIITGICMYERQGWARYVYLATGIIYLFQRYITHRQIIETLKLHPPAPGHHNWETLAFAIVLLFYIFSAIMLFTFQARRYFHPPMYVDD